MNFNLNKVIEEIANNNELSEEFSKLNEMDEIYDYCKSMGVECDEREFDKEISGYIYALDDDYNMVAGGIKHENESYLKNQFDNLNVKILNLDYSSNLAPNSNKWEKTQNTFSNFNETFDKKVTLGSAVLDGGMAFLKKNYK